MNTSDPFTIRPATIDDADLGCDVKRHKKQVTIKIEPFFGSRSELLPLFSEADDSPAEINRYMELGEVLVARHGQEIVGHIQLIGSGTDWEIKSVAVVNRQRGQGIGTALVRTARTRAFSAGATRLLVSTATADIDNVGFYQRLGFRMCRIEKNAFTPERGYSILQVDGIPVRDKVWFSIDSNDVR